MPVFSPASLAQLRTCDPRLQRVLERVIKSVDFQVLEGHRGQQAQDRAFAEGHSQKRWPDGNHNKFPSRAVDIAPFPVDWKDARRFHYLAGFVLAIASTMGIKLRWGGAWNDLADGDLGDLNGPSNFNDLPHFEVVD
jgi:peptidoglycan L-alanyl-D-glutamate endopeptidase CwlK